MKSFILLVLLCGLMSPAAWALTNSVPAESADFESNVHIRVDALDRSTGDIVPGYCNATFVDARTLVTAAHCLVDAAILNARSILIVAGSYRYKLRPDGTTWRIGYGPDSRKETTASFYFTPTVQRKIRPNGPAFQIMPEDDVAVAVLTEPMPLKEGFKFAQVISQPEMQNFRQSTMSHTPTVVTINALAEVHSNDTKRMARLNNFSSTHTGSFESKSGSRVEQGDSGSPVYVRMGSQWKLAAVVKGEGHTMWSSWDAFGPMDSHICEVASQIQDAQIRGRLCVRGALSALNAE